MRFWSRDRGSDNGRRQPRRACGSRRRFAGSQRSLVRGGNRFRRRPRRVFQLMPGGAHARQGILRGLRFRVAAGGWGDGPACWGPRRRRGLFLLALRRVCLGGVRVAAVRGRARSGPSGWRALWCAAQR